MNILKITQKNELKIDEFKTIQDPTLSTGRCDSLLKRKKKKKVSVFEFWEIRALGGMVLFVVATYFLFLFFLNEEN